MIAAVIYDSFAGKYPAPWRVVMGFRSIARDVADVSYDWRNIMRVAEAMTREVCIASPDQSIMEAARKMDEYDCGALPVVENDKLIGMTTDRDIVVRAIAKGKTGETKIGEVMSPQIKYCFEDEDVEDVARNMAELQVRRLPVVNNDKRLVGIVTIGDLSQPGRAQFATDAFSNIVQPSF
jgi:CBS domain-containing protein